MAASVYKGLTIQIGADTTKLTSALRQAQKSAEGTTKQLRQINSALKLDPHNTELLAQKQELLTKQIAASNEKLGILKETMKQVSKEDVTSEQWTQLVTDISRTESQLEKLKGELEETARQERLASSGAADYAEKLGKIGDKAQEVGGKIESVGDKIQSLGGGISNIGGALTAGVTAPIVAAAGASVKAAIDIDSGLTSVKKTVDGTEEQYQQLKDAAIEFSQTNAVGADQMLEIDALGAQLGFAIEELELFGQVASGLDIATDMDAETASTEMAQFANITKMAHDDIERYASSIVNVGNNMATTESKVSAMSQRIAAAGTQVKMSQADILGWSGAMSSLGIEAEAGGSAFSTIISKIDAVVSKSGNLDKLTESQKTYTKAIEDAQARLNELNKIKLDVGKKGMSTDEWISLNNEIAKTKETISSSKKALGETDKDMGEILGKLESFAGLAGMSGDEFRKAWGENATDTLQKVLKGLDGVDNKTVALEELEITELRQVDAMKRLAGNTDLVSEALKTANEGWNENTALQNEVDNRNESLASKFEILKNKVVAVADQVGKPLADALLDAVDAAEPLIEMVEKGAQAFADMSKEEQQNMLKNVALVASLGPLLSIAGKTVSVFGGMVKGVGAATKAFGSFSSGLSSKIAKMSQMSGVAGKLGGALSGVSGGLIGIGAAAGIAVAAFAISKWQEYQQELEDTEESAKSLKDMEEEAAESVKKTNDELKDNTGYEDYRSQIRETEEAIDDLREKQANANREFENSFKELNIDTSQLEPYLKTIEELGNKDLPLTVEQQAELKNAVEQYNDITGDSLEIIDLQRGALSKNTAEIKSNTDQWIRNARMQIYQDRIKSAIEEQIAAQENLDNALEQHKAAQEKVNGVVKQQGELYRDYLDRLHAAQDEERRTAQAVSEARTELGNANRIISEASDEIQDMQTQEILAAATTTQWKDTINAFSDDTKQAMQDAGINVDDLAQKFADAGISSGTMKSLTAENFQKMYEECGGDINLIIEKLKDLDRVQVAKKKVEMDSSEIDWAAAKVGELAKKLKEPLQGKALIQFGTGVGVVKGPFNAAGGIKIPKHADGGILSKPTLTSVGWVGEAGAEAIIPLDNPNYSRKFARAIAQQMTSNQTNSKTVQIILNGAVLNDDAAMQEAALDLLEQIQRRAGMNRG